MEKQEKVKKKINETFLQMAREMPIPQIQVKTLTQRAGVSRSAFYVYYDSIWDVLQEVEDELIDHASSIKRPAETAGSPVQKDLEVFHEMLSYLIANTSAVEALTTHGGDEAWLASWEARIRKQLSLWRGVPLKEDRIEFQLLAEYTIGGIQRLLTEWSKKRGQLTAEEERNMFDRVFLLTRSLFIDN